MAHKLKITLKYTDPKVYRTVIVPENLTFHGLHIVIQSVMNWEEAHFYQFNLGEVYRSDTIELINDEDDFADFFGANKYNKMEATSTYLSDYFNGQIKKMNYTYDFGDDWQHEIKVLQKPKEEVLYPTCIKGENAAPVEDCGGIPGFRHLLEVCKKKRKNEDDKEMLEWLGIPKNRTYEDYFAFEIEDVNNFLKLRFKEGGVLRMDE